MTFLQDASWNVLWLLVLIGVMILIHELGHYWAALLFDVRVDAFSFGFGPRLFGFRRGETDFRFSLILFGGYVKMAGEQPGDENASDPRSFMAKPRWQRLIIAFAGPFMNIILAVVILTGLFMVRFPKLPNDPSPTIGYVTPDGAAAKAGIREGDRIVRIENSENPTWEDVAIKAATSGDHSMDVWVERGGKRQRLAMTPTLDPHTGIGVAGWEEQGQIQIAGFQAGMDAERAGLRIGDILAGINGVAIRSQPQMLSLISGAEGKPVEIEYLRSGHSNKVLVTPLKSKADGAERWMIGVRLQPRMVFVSLSFPDAVSESIRQNTKDATMIYTFLRGIVERKMSPKSLTGPIGIGKAAGDAAREGALPFFGLMSMVSLNLAIFNLLPIPILDGGMILMLLVEMLMRRDMSLQVKETVVKLGFVFLMMVVAFVLYNDISKMAL